MVNLAARLTPDVDRSTFRDRPSHVPNADDLSR